jgi:nitrite reductase/ring-hydroxylating ferredoxin subunit
MPIWYKIADTLAEIASALPPNRPALVQADAHQICLFMAPDGLKAMQNACPHLGAPLHRGHVNYLGEVTCPWHSYRYSSQTGEECEGRSAPAKVLPIRIDEKGVFVEV